MQKIIFIIEKIKKYRKCPELVGRNFHYGSKEPWSKTAVTPVFHISGHFGDILNSFFQECNSYWY